MSTDIKYCNETSILSLSWPLLSSITRDLEYTFDIGLQGDYYEFGVYFGGSFQHAQREAHRLNLNGTRFWGFDSFRGLPEVADTDLDAGFHSGAYTCDRATTERLLNQWGFDWSCADLIEGWYEDTLTSTLAAEKDMKPAAVVAVDCDLYKSTVPVLRFMSPLLQSGTVIIFDDWGNYKEDDGERKAFMEFISDHPEWVAEDLPSFSDNDKSFVMRKRV